MASEIMEKFSQKQLRFMDFVEQCHYINKQLPSAERAIAAVAGLTREDYKEYTTNDRIVRHLRDARGIDISAAANTEALSAEQLVVANTLLDLSDKRSERNKLKDLKVSTTKYEAWKRDPAFAKYMRDRAENALGEHMPDIHMALIDTAKRGDVSGMKLYYEMTGRFSSKTVEQVNIEFLMMKIIEVLAKNIEDPVLLGRISEDLGALAPGAKPAMEAPRRAMAIEQPRIIDQTPTEPVEKKAFEL